MRSPSRIQRSATSTAALLCAAACAGADPTGPAAPTAYDVTVAIETIYVLGDCEVRDGNPGEFDWRVTLSLPLRRSASTAVGGDYPNRGGAASYADGQTITLANTDVTLTGIPAADVEDLVLLFQVIEWDPDGPDPDMNDRSVVAPVLLGQDGARQLAGLGSSRCGLRFWYRPHWRPSPS